MELDCTNTMDLLVSANPSGQTVIKDIEIYGGCNGNLSGIKRLIVGRKAEEVISLLRGTTCGPRPTSCPDQISLALEKALEMEKAAV